MYSVEIISARWGRSLSSSLSFSFSLFLSPSLSFSLSFFLSFFVSLFLSLFLYFSLLCLSIYLSICLFVCFPLPLSFSVSLAFLSVLYISHILSSTLTGSTYLYVTYSLTLILSLSLCLSVATPPVADSVCLPCTPLSLPLSFSGSDCDDLLMAACVLI